MESIFEAIKDDPERDTLGQLLQAWHKLFGNKPTMVRQLVAHAQQNPEGDLHELLIDIANDKGRIDRKRLGHWINRNSGRIVDGMRFVDPGGKRSAKAWCAESGMLAEVIAALSRGDSVEASVNELCEIVRSSTRLWPESGAFWRPIIENLNNGVRFEYSAAAWKLYIELCGAGF